MGRYVCVEKGGVRPCTVLMKYPTGVCTIDVMWFFVINAALVGMRSICGPHASAYGSNCVV